MANLRTTRDCLDYMLRRASELPQGQGSRFEDHALLHLNLAHRELISGVCRLAPGSVVNFPFAKSRREKALVLQPAQSIGSVSVVKGYSQISLSSVPNISVVDWRIRIGGGNTAYRIIQHTQSTSPAVLDCPVAEDTNAVASFVLFKDEYEIGDDDIMRFISPATGYYESTSGDPSLQIDGIDEFDFRKAFPIISQGEPTHFCSIKQTNGTWVLRFSHYPISERRVELPYIEYPDDLVNTYDDVPQLPLEHRLTMCELALFYLFQDKVDDRAFNCYNNAQVGYANMLAEIGIKDVSFEPFRPNVQTKGA